MKTLGNPVTVVR